MTNFSAKKLELKANPSYSSVSIFHLCRLNVAQNSIGISAKSEF